MEGIGLRPQEQARQRSCRCGQTGARGTIALDQRSSLVAPFDQPGDFWRERLWTMLQLVPDRMRVYNQKLPGIVPGNNPHARRR